MKKILISSLALSMLVFSGCSYEERCESSDSAKVESLWSPKLDSIIVDWMPNVKNLTPYYNELADCIRFGRNYMPQHEFLKSCENDMVEGKFELDIRAKAESFKMDSNVVSLRVELYAYSGSDAKRYFYSNIENVLFDVYGCTAYSCVNASKIHVYGDSNLFDLWLPPENFKIVEMSASVPSPWDGYNSYHHFDLNVNSSSLNAIIKIESDDRCYGHWEKIRMPFVWR